MPAEPRQAATIPLDEQDMLDVIYPLGEADLIAMPPPIPEPSTIYLPKDYEQLTEVYPIHDLNDPAVWNSVFVEEIKAPSKPPPPPPEAFAGERRKHLMAIVKELDLAIDADYFARLQTVAAESKFDSTTIVYPESQMWSCPFMPGAPPPCPKHRTPAIVSIPKPYPY